jgi:heterodisulfide reductase subunit A
MKAKETEKPRIGVYVCDCGSNIASKVDVPEVVAHAATLPYVVVAREYKYMCADPGQMLIRKDIGELKLNRVVVASCSPHLHEATFRKVTMEGGQNPYLFHMANIREHASWVTDDGEEATWKAKSIVSGAVFRVAFHEELVPQKMDVRSETLVVGGGIAGISAALTIANSGKKVYLVEKEPTIGGHMAKFDKTFPTLDCASCILTPKMTEVKDHPNIEMITYAEVSEVSGFVGNFHIKVLKKPRYVIEDECIGCNACVDQCVYKVPKFKSEFDEGVGLRKPVYIPFPQAVPNYAVIDPETCIEFKSHHCKKTCVTACNEVAGRNAIDFDQKPSFVEFDVGAVIVTTGFKTFDPSHMPQYGYGRFPNVYTSLEVERLVNASGPTNGELVLRNGEKPQTVGIIHCVGSRDKKHNKWCSKVCCMYSLKLAHLIRERTGAEVYNFYIDMRTPGKGYEEFYERLLEEGTHMIRGRVAEVSDWTMTEKENGKLIIRAEDTLIGVVRRIPVDMVILSVGLEPRKDAKDVRRMFNMSCSEEGWFQERHPKLAPVSTFTDGVFIAGACSGPKDIPESVAQAQAAASEVMALVDKGFIEMEPNIAIVDEAKCSGCHVCLALCPYGAIHYEKDLGIARINEALCKGCGTCVGACPSKAINQQLFRDDQIFAQLEGLLTV